MGIVYKITNIINNKSYVGMTIFEFEHRWKRHLSAVRQGSTFRFHSAIRKYGIDAWNHEILFESDDMMELRKFEEEYIICHKLIGNGYNAKPGGCGGWIVPKEKYDNWKKMCSENNTGANNGNALPISNDEIVDMGMKFIDKYGFIPGGIRFRRFCLEFDVKIPKTFQFYRFGGKYSNLVKILEDKSGLKYNMYYRDEIQREQLRKVNLGKKRNKLIEE